MIELTQQVCQELGLTYWQLNTGGDSNLIKQHRISHEEKELLRKILLSKAVILDQQQLKIKANNVVVINLKNHQLIFDDVTLPDSQHTTHLSKIEAMLNSTEEKKLTWYKLKGLDL